MVVTGLESGRIYYFRVRAETSVGVGDLSRQHAIQTRVASSSTLGCKSSLPL